MVVISVPTRLRIATFALFLSIPVIAIEVVIATRSPWWNLPYRSIGYWCLAFALICFPISSWLMGGRKWALRLLIALLSLWVLESARMSIFFRYPALGFFTLLLGALCFLEVMWLQREMRRSFFDPQVQWYQSLPKPIPGLMCEIVSGEKSIDLRVSRIDRDGAFVFVEPVSGKVSNALASVLEKRKLELTFNFRDRRMSCQAAPTLSIAKGTGAGLRFLDVSADLGKEIGDFVEVLRGEGYV